MTETLLRMKATLTHELHPTRRQSEAVDTAESV
jgi:hypothetical protein